MLMVPLDFQFPLIYGEYTNCLFHKNDKDHSIKMKGQKILFS